MLDIADHDLVASLQMRRAPALRDQVDRLGRAAHDTISRLVAA